MKICCGPFGISMAGSLPARSAAFGSCDLCADLCLCQPPCQPPYQEAAGAGDALAASARHAVTAIAQRALPTTRRSRRDGVLWCRACKISNFAPDRRGIVLSPAADSSGRDQLSPSRECDAAVANCGKTSITKTQRNAPIDAAIYSAPRTRLCILVRFACHAQLRTHCQHCDTISGARQMPPPKAHRNAGARHDRRSWS